MDKQFIVVVCGPTASGKTALSVELAKRLSGEIISADSMQIYRGMNIATGGKAGHTALPYGFSRPARQLFGSRLC